MLISADKIREVMRREPGWSKDDTWVVQEDAQPVLGRDRKAAVLSVRLRVLEGLLVPGNVGNAQGDFLADRLPSGAESTSNAADKMPMAAIHSDSMHSSMASLAEAMDTVPMSPKLPTRGPWKGCTINTESFRRRFVGHNGGPGVRFSTTLNEKALTAYEEVTGKLEGVVAGETGRAAGEALAGEMLSAMAELRAEVAGLRAELTTPVRDYIHSWPCSLS